MFQFFQNEHVCTFPDHEAVAPAIPGPPAVRHAYSIMAKLLGDCCPLHCLYFQPFLRFKLTGIPGVGGILHDASVEDFSAL